MKHLIFSLPVLIMSIFYSCKPQEAADLVILNGKVLTIDTDNPLAEAIAVVDDKITDVGTNSSIRKLIDPEKTQIIDASGRLVIPGFNDAHVHFGPLDPDFIALRYTTDPSTITAKVKAQVAKSIPGELIRGGHWEHEMFITGMADKSLSTRSHPISCCTCRRWSF